jgi:hypothetical protein
MSLKSKLMNIIPYSKLVTLGIGLAITFGIGIVSRVVEVQQAHAVFAYLGFTSICCC